LVQDRCISLSLVFIVVADLWGREDQFPVPDDDDNDDDNHNYDDDGDDEDNDDGDHDDGDHDDGDDNDDVYLWLHIAPNTCHIP
jgi:ABC-type Zn2+ transport system substrate-binding protein/surface adhesin